MADIHNIQNMARQLNLSGIAKGLVDLQCERLSNLDYFEAILKQELQIRHKNRNIRLRKAVNFRIKHSKIHCYAKA